MPITANEWMNSTLKLHECKWTVVVVIHPETFEQGFAVRKAVRYTSVFSLLNAFSQTAFLKICVITRCIHFYTIIFNGTMWEIEQFSHTRTCNYTTSSFLFRQWLAVKMDGRWMHRRHVWHMFWHVLCIDLDLWYAAHSFVYYIVVLGA